MIFMLEHFYANIETIILQFLNLYETLCSHTGITGMDNLQFNFPKPGLTTGGCAFPSLEECLMPLSSAALCQIKHKAHSHVFLQGLGADESLVLSAGVSAVRTASLELLLDSQIGSQTPGMEQQHSLGAASLNSGQLSNGTDPLQKGSRDSKHRKWAIVTHKRKERLLNLLRSATCWS